jgi:hypothetical protein
MLDGVRSIGEALMAVDKTISMATAVMGNMGGLFFEDSWVTQAKKDIANYIATVQADAKQLQGDRTAAVPDDGWAMVKTDIWGLWSYCTLVQGQFPPDSQTMLARVQDAISGAADDLSYGLQQAPKLIGEAVDVASGVVGDVAGLAGGTAAALLGPVKWYLIGGGVLLVGGLVVYLLVAGGAARKLAGGTP